MNGQLFTLAGPDAGDKGVYLGTSLDGIYDPPVKTVWEEPANLPGARYLAHKIMRRDIVFGVEIVNDSEPGRTWLDRDSEWRKAWSFERDCKLWVTTDSGRRYLSVRLGESPLVDMSTDPTLNPLNLTLMTVIAGDPFWYGEEVVHDWVLDRDLKNVPLVKDGDINPAAVTHEFDIAELNPTDQPVWPVWVISAPSRVVLPDYSWLDDDFAQRRVVMPSLVEGEDIVVDVDPRSPQVVSWSGSQVWARMAGVRFRHPISPYTRRAQLPVTIAQAPAGAKVQLRLKRPWSRPWGLW